MSTLNPFQWLALSCLAVVLLIELAAAFRGRVHRGFWAVRIVIWISTVIAIYQPDFLTRAARAVGIQRGADLLLYLTVIVFFLTSVFLYARLLRLQQQITYVVRHLAIAEARAPEGARED